MGETLEVLSAFMGVALTGPRDRVTIRWRLNSSAPLPGAAWRGACIQPLPQGSPEPPVTNGDGSTVLLTRESPRVWGHPLRTHPWPLLISDGLRVFDGL